MVENLEKSLGVEHDEGKEITIINLTKLVFCSDGVFIYNGKDYLGHIEVKDANGETGIFHNGKIINLVNGAKNDLSR